MSSTAEIYILGYRVAIGIVVLLLVIAAIIILVLLKQYRLALKQIGSQQEPEKPSVYYENQNGPAQMSNNEGVAFASAYDSIDTEDVDMSSSVYEQVDNDKVVIL